MKNKKQNESQLSQNKQQSKNQTRSVSQAGQRYKVHLKQEHKQWKLNLFSCHFRTTKICGSVDQFMAKLWNKIMPVYVRGPYNQQQLLLSYFKSSITELKEETMMKIQSVGKRISRNRSYQQDLFRNGKSICIILAKQNILDLIQQIDKTQFFSQILNSQKQGNQIMISFLIVDLKRDAELIATIKSFFDEEEDKDISILNQITKNIMNQKYSNRKSQQSNRYCLPKTANTIKSQNQSVGIGTEGGQKIFPLIVPFWLGIFNEMLMLQPRSIQQANLSQILKDFQIRKEFQEKVKNYVFDKKQGGSQQKCKESPTNYNVQEMNSVHKIHVSSFKEYF